MRIEMKRSVASAADLKVVDQLADQSLPEGKRGLAKFVPEKIQPAQAAVCCSDGSKPYMRRAHEDFCSNNAEGEAFYHPYIAHGAAMLCAPNSTLMKEEDIAWRFLLPQFHELQDPEHGIAAAKIGTRVKQLNLLHHWPCKKAEPNSFAWSILQVIMAKVRIREEMQGALKLFPDVVPLLFIDLPGEDNPWEIYRIKKEGFVYWASRFDRSLYRTWQAFERLYVPSKHWLAAA